MYIIYNIGWVSRVFSPESFISGFPLSGVGPASLINSLFWPQLISIVYVCVCVVMKTLWRAQQALPQCVK